MLPIRKNRCGKAYLKSLKIRSSLEEYCNKHGVDMKVILAIYEKGNEKIFKKLMKKCRKYIDARKKHWDICDGNK